MLRIQLLRIIPPASFLLSGGSYFSYIYFIILFCLVIGQKIHLFSWAQVAHAYNPSYPGGQRSGGLQFEASPGK
jgi:hypothetical protein